MRFTLPFLDIFPQMHDNFFPIKKIKLKIKL